MRGNLYFGIDSVYAPEYSKWSPEKNRGTVVFDEQFNITAPDAQVLITRTQQRAHTHNTHKFGLRPSTTLTSSPSPSPSSQSALLQLCDELEVEDCLPPTGGTTPYPVCSRPPHTHTQCPPTAPVCACTPHTQCRSLTPLLCHWMCAAAAGLLAPSTHITFYRYDEMLSKELQSGSARK